MTVGILFFLKELGGIKGNEVAYSMCKVEDGGIVIVGYTTSVGFGATDIFVVKFSPEGDLVWSKIFGGNGNDIASKVLSIGDKIFITGYSDSFNGEEKYEVVILTLDLKGKLLFSWKFSGEKNFVPLCAHYIDGSGIAIGGYEEIDRTGGKLPFLLFLDSQFNIRWVKVINFQDKRGVCFSLFGGGDCPIIGVGKLNSKVHIFKVDLNGFDCGIMEDVYLNGFPVNFFNINWKPNYYPLNFSIRELDSDMFSPEYKIYTLCTNQNLGDLNLDGVVNELDVDLLSKYLISNLLAVDEIYSDMDGNGIIDMVDLYLLEMKVKR